MPVLQRHALPLASFVNSILWYKPRGLCFVKLGGVFIFWQRMQRWPSFGSMFELLCAARVWFLKHMYSVCRSSNEVHRNGMTHLSSAPPTMNRSKLNAVNSEHASALGFHSTEWAFHCRCQIYFEKFSQSILDIFTAQQSQQSMSHKYHIIVLSI